MNTDIYFNGFFTAEHMQTYRKDGIRLHKPPFGESVWSATAGLLYAEFIDRQAKTVTDLFYGACNDFNVWFNAKAARGDRFDVIVHGCDDSGYDRAGTRVGCINSEFGTLVQGEDGAWSLIEFEPLMKIAGKYFLRNMKFAFALRSNGKRDEEAAIIAKSLEHERRYAE